MARVARTLRHTCKPTHTASVLNNRTPLDVASGPWRAVIELLTMGYGGLGGRAGTAVPEGTVRELPNLPFPSFPIRASLDFHGQ